MEQLLSTVVIAVGVAFVLLVIGAVAGSVVTGRQIRDAIAAQPAPVIHNTATANAGGEGGGSGVAIGVPQIVGLLGGLALLAWALTGFRTGSIEQQPAVQINSVATAVPVPTVAATQSATAMPVATMAPVSETISKPEVHPLEIVPQPERSVNWLHVAIGALAILTVGLWVYAGAMLWNRRSIKRPNVVTTKREARGAERSKAAQSARESRLESIIPEAVNDLESK